MSGFGPPHAARSAAIRRAPSGGALLLWTFTGCTAFPRTFTASASTSRRSRRTIPIPNLIEIEKNSYERFLQMNRLPAEREDAGLQSVFKSVFPISDFRENSSLEFIDYSIGNWECKCGKLVGPAPLAQAVRQLRGHAGRRSGDGDRDVLCPRCGRTSQARGDVCDICGQTVGLEAEVRRGRVP